MEDILIRKIKGGMLGMRQGTKTQEEIGRLLNKLKDINKPMYDDLLNDYKKTIELLSK